MFLNLPRDALFSEVSNNEDKDNRVVLQIEAKSQHYNYGKRKRDLALSKPVILACL